MPTRAEIEKSLTDFARTLAPVDLALKRTSLKSAEVQLLSQVAGMLVARHDALPTAAASAPAWVTAARTKLGEREIPGPRHNSWIAQGWAKLNAGWFNDDETAWCGFFVAWAMQQAGIEYPGGGKFARALAWLNWGKPSQPVLGAVVVFKRSGGGHVGILVGESATHYYVLGGNQDNQVSIAPYSKTARKPEGFRWPASLPAGTTPLPKMSGGVVTRSEA